MYQYLNNTDVAKKTTVEGVGFPDGVHQASIYKMWVAPAGSLAKSKKPRKIPAYRTFYNKTVDGKEGEKVKVFKQKVNALGLFL